MAQTSPTTTRPIASVLRTLAAADPSVALVASMHPSVLGFWLAKPDPEPRRRGPQQRDAVCATRRRRRCSGARSRPSRAAAATSLRTSRWPTRRRATARVPGAGYRVTGDKHFGSGSGVTSFMITTAVADGRGRADRSSCSTCATGRGTARPGCA